MTAPPSRRWWVLAVVAIAQLMVVLDNTIVNISLPSAQADLGFSDAERQWVVTAYALAFGSLLLLGGRLSDRIGRRATFTTGLVGFAVVSVVGGLSVDFTMLVVARAVQGAFGALLAPAALSVLTTTFPAGPQRGRAFGVFGAVAGSGAALGLLLGGVLTQVLDWRWCLFVNVVFAGVALVGAAILLERPERGEQPRFDLLGTVTAAAGLFCITYGFATAETGGWSSPEVPVFLAVGVVLLVAFVLIERRVAGPLLPLRVVADRTRGGAYLAVLLVALSMFAVTLFLTYYLQQDVGFSPIVTGVAFLPMVAAIVATSTTVPNTLLPRLGPKPLIGLGMLVAAGGLFWLSFIEPGGGYVTHVLPPLIVLGLGVGTAMSTAINTATLGVQRADAGVASATVNTMQQVGGSVGTALLSSIAGTATASAATAGPAAAVDGYATAFLVAAAIIAGGAIVCGTLVPFGRPQSAEAGAAPAEAEAAPEEAAPADGVRPRVDGRVLTTTSRTTTLTLVDAARGLQVDRATSGTDGRFRLEPEVAGEYLLVAAAPGHRPLAERVHVADDRPATPEVRLAPDS